MTLPSPSQHPPHPPATPTALPRLDARRLVAALREGGSLPGLMEAEDGSLWVVKFRGAGQGPRALVAELIVGGLGRRLGLPVPQLALLRLDAQAESFSNHDEVRDLLRASAGVNVGLAFLDGSFNFELLDAADLVGPELAAAVVWLDALTLNIDRTPRNPNILIHSRRPWLIDHGAALYFHHRWPASALDGAQRPFPPVADHVLLPLAGDILEADARLAPLLTPELVAAVVATVPSELLSPHTDAPAPAFADAAANRAAYVEYLLARLAGPRPFAAEAERLRRAQADRPAPRPLSHRR